MFRRIVAALILMTVPWGSAVVPSPPVVAAPPCATWCPVATFDDYADGSLRSQGPWHVNTPGATDGALAAADVPAGFSGKAMVDRPARSGTPVQYRGNAYASLGDTSIADGATGTLFFEFATDDPATTNLHLGLSADESPGLGFDTTGDPLDLADLAVRLTVDARGLVLRDGEVDRPVGNVALTAKTIHRVWTVVDTAAGTYRVYVATPGAAPGGTPVRAVAGGVDTFAMSGATRGPLVTFLHLNDPDDLPVSTSYLDSLYVDPDAATLTDPSPAYESVTTFDGYATGALAGQDGWRTSSSAVAVTADPAPPTGVTGNRVVRMTGANLRADRAVPGVAEGSTGTLFFRFRRSGSVDTSVGLSDVAAPSAFGDFEAQANSQAAGTLNARDGGAFSAAGTFSPLVWQCVWVVADNAADRVTVYSRGGPYAVTTRLPVDRAATYAFRNGSTAALGRFLALNGASSPGELYLDDVAVDTSGVNLRVPGGRSDSCVAIDAAERPLTDPLPGDPVRTGLGVTLREVATLPPSGGTGARVNYVGEVPDGSHRLFAPDLNGTMYLLRDGRPIRYLDVAGAFPDFRLNPSLGTGFGFVAFHPDFATNGRFYTVHTEAGGALTSRTPDLPAPATTSVHGVVTEWTAADPAADTFTGTRREVLRLGFDTFLHGIQQIGFDPTAAPGAADRGLLYVAVGDGEEVPNFTTGALDLGMPQGKILRIDPSGAPRYRVPAGNPFVGRAGALGEVYAAGLRNPHRFSWDPQTRAMYVGMIGEANIDSVYEVRPGDNYGWNEREGGFRFKTSDPTHVYPLPPDDDGRYTYPVLSYDHDTGNALVGGFVYRGRGIPELRGKYVFGDIVSGRVFYTDVNRMRRGGPLAPIYELTLYDPTGTPVTLSGLVGNSRVDYRSGIDADGELLFSAKANGRIWRVTAPPPAAGCTTGSTTLTNVTAAANWAPVTPSKWRFPGTEVVLAEAGTARPGPRRPYEDAVLTAGPVWAGVQIDAEVRLDAPVSANDRDVVLLFGYQSDTRYYYVHLSQDNASYPHNGIFLVDDADRLRIDDQWTGTVGARPAVTDTAWHRVRVRHCAATASIEVYVDGATEPLMTATDPTFRSGRVGFGSFDNTGRLRALTVTGDPVTARAGR